MEQESLKTVGRRMLALMAFFAFLILFGGLLGQYRGWILSLVTPTMWDEAGISPKTRFVLRMDEDSAKRVTLEPESGFSLEKTGSNLYTLIPDRLLPPGDVVAVKAMGRTYPFSVRNELVFTGFSPADEAEDVPTDSQIVLEFNTPALDLAAFSGAFYIRPKVEGALEAEGGVVTLTPHGRLEAGTEYQVMVDIFSDSNGALLDQPLSFAFTTAGPKASSPGRREFRLAGEAHSLNMLSTEPPLLEVILGEGPTVVRASVSAFESWDQFSMALEERLSGSAVSVDAARLPVAARFDLEPIPMAGENSARKLLSFPEALPEGWYLVTLQPEGYPEGLAQQILMQVSSLSVYSALSGGEALVWVNDAATGQPVAGAEVLLLGGGVENALTDEEGIARLPGPAAEALSGGEAASLLLTVRDDRRHFVADVGGYVPQPPGTEATSAHMGYLYIDRTLYRPGDTVSLWGVVMSRGDAPLPRTVTVEMEGGDRQEVDLPPDGAFVLSLPLAEAANPALRRISLMAEQEMIASVLIRVEPSRTGGYRLATLADQPAFLTSGVAKAREVSATIRVLTPDGKPVSGLQLRLSGHELLDRVTTADRLVTDEGGYATNRWRVHDDRDTWRPQYYPYTFMSDEGENSFLVDGEIAVIHRDAMLTLTPVWGEVFHRVEIAVHDIDLSRIREPYQLAFEENLKGEGLSRQVLVELHRVSCEKQAAGQRYDFRFRAMTDGTDYRQVDEVISTWDVTTRNGGYLLTRIPAVDTEQGTYYLRAVIKDSLGRDVVEELALSPPREPDAPPPDGKHRYSLARQILPEPDGIPLDGFDCGDLLGAFADGETVVFTLRDNGLPVGLGEGRLLLWVMQEGIRRVLTFGPGEEIAIPYEDELLPNYVIGGAYFDGARVYPLRETPMVYSPRRRELAVSVSLGEETCRSGEAITVTLTVTDPSTGLPVPGASLLLSAAEEAILSATGGQPEILPSLYRPLYHPVICSYASYHQFLQEEAPPTSHGDEPPPQVHMEFQPSAAFLAARTDEEGNAVLVVPLPEVSALWRLTALAVTSDGYGGSGIARVAAFE